MKTIADLTALIPSIIEAMHKKGIEFGDYNEVEYESNYVFVEQDGWEIEVYYRCTGYWAIESETWDNPGCCELTSGWGEVDEVTASHYDEATEEQTDFSDEELKDFYEKLNEALEDLV